MSSKQAPFQTEDGFKVDFLNEGEGDVCPTGSRVAVHYTGKLTNGTVFDSSRRRGDPLEFIVGVGQVIKGWDLGITQLKTGQKAVLTCPPQYAYGDRGAGGLIPPGATLIFDVELVEFLAPEPKLEITPENEEYYLRQAWDFTVSDHDTLLSLKGVQVLRCLLSLSCYILTILSLLKFPVSSQIYYFTNIGNNLVWISGALQFLLGGEKGKSNFGLFKTTVALSEFAMTFQIIITVVYWTLLHSWIVGLAYKDPSNPDLELYWLMVFIHSWPLVAAFGIFYFTKGYLFEHHSSYLLKFGPIYLLINLFGTWQRGENLYPFFPWFEAPLQALVTSIAMFAGAMYLYRKACGALNGWFKEENRPVVVEKKDK
ncbi:hypothetical protein FGO68_gene4394 [Halteria grandinella]|uniref:peptidylprolyl isomerase n=1 Tax=Halteria grandinella TaxID=5974 RepID=A0A8J8T0I6_HALGN|nr:hypothetical protein FGO68_gene4394 [Halteria grandinella]